jgi:hypothetical protein
MKIRVDSWVEAALDVDSVKLAKLISDLPPSDTRSMAAFLAQWSALESRVHALRSVSQEHAFSGDPELGAGLADVGIGFCKRAYELLGPGAAGTFLSGIRQFAVHAHRAHDRMDRREDQRSVVEDAIEWLRTRGVEALHLTDLRFARIESLIELGQLEKARESLNSEAAAGNAGHPSFGLLDQRISSRLISVRDRK